MLRLRLGFFRLCLGLVYGSLRVCFGMFLRLDFFTGFPWAWFGAWHLWGLLVLGLTSLGFGRFALGFRLFSVCLDFV